MTAAVMTPPAAGPDVFLGAVRALIARHDGAETTEDLQTAERELAAATDVLRPALRKVRRQLKRITQPKTEETSDGQGQERQAGRAAAQAAGGVGALRAVDEGGAPARARVAAGGPVRRLEARQGLGPAWEAEQAPVEQLQALEVPWPAPAWLVDAQVATGREPGDVVAVGAIDDAAAVAPWAQDARVLPGGEHGSHATAAEGPGDSRQSGAPTEPIPRVFAVFDPPPRRHLKPPPFWPTSAAVRSPDSRRPDTPLAAGPPIRHRHRRPKHLQPPRQFADSVRIGTAVAAALLVILGLLVVGLLDNSINVPPVYVPGNPPEVGTLVVPQPGKTLPAQTLPAQTLRRGER